MVHSMQWHCIRRLAGSIEQNVKMSKIEDVLQGGLLEQRVRVQHPHRRCMLPRLLLRHTV